MHSGEARMIPVAMTVFNSPKEIIQAVDRTSFLILPSPVLIQLRARQRSDMKKIVKDFLKLLAPNMTP